MEFTWTMRNGSPCAVNQSWNWPAFSLLTPKLAISVAGQFWIVKCIWIYQNFTDQRNTGKFLCGRISNMNTNTQISCFSFHIRKQKHTPELCEEFLQPSTCKMDHKDVCNKTFDFSLIVGLLSLLSIGPKSVRIWKRSERGRGFVEPNIIYLT